MVLEQYKFLDWTGMLTSVMANAEEQVASLGPLNCLWSMRTMLLWLALAC
jgi:hypothetical protein